MRSFVNRAMLNGLLALAVLALASVAQGTVLRNRQTGETISTRNNVCDEYIKAYTREILEHFDIDELKNTLGQNAKNVVFFCFEKNAKACHRSLVAEYLQKNLNGVTVMHL